MLQRVRSATTSSKSNTSKPASPVGGAATVARRDTPVQFVKGVGPRLGAIFASRGVTTVRDLLYFFPRAYEDRTKLKTIAELVDGEKATVAVRVISARSIPIRMGKKILEVRCTDDSATLVLKWFHAPRGMEQRFTAGTQVVVTGPVKLFMNQPQIIHPEITWNSSADVAGVVNVEGGGAPSESADFGRVVPIYTEIEGVSSRLLRKILWEGLEKFFDVFDEDIPERFLEARKLPPLGKAVRFIHFPDEKEAQLEKLVDFGTPAHARLIYEEFFKFEFIILKRKLRMQREAAQSFGAEGGREAVAALEKLLPFQLTGDQKRAIDEIMSDILLPHPMNRLIQGDVGSGKTAVAFLTAGAVLAEGGQACLMAPTEILAEQHYKNAVKIFGGRLNVLLLTGKTSGADRTKIQGRLRAGEPVLLDGTHAVIEDPVEFKNLAYILIDEQHRFGVEQRRALRNKGIRQGLRAHSLILSATPIPRTLALTAYGDLGVTQIKEMPPGRSPILTKVIRDKNNLGRAYETIRRELREGRQIYCIYPLVNDSEAEGFTQLKSAVAEVDRLSETFAPFKAGLLHGQMKPEEKGRVMEAFNRNELQILVSTTVVEVGVDVPNATVMAVEHAERFGLSQLHQLRGRVGRGKHQSYCFLMTHQRIGEGTAQRLEVLEETTDGFRIAEADLEIRGPGEFLGTRQAGGLPFKIANLVRDREWLFQARDDATELLRDDPDLEKPENARLRRYFDREGNLQGDRFKTS